MGVHTCSATGIALVYWPAGFELQYSRTFRSFMNRDKFLKVENFPKFYLFLSFSSQIHARIPDRFEHVYKTVPKGEVDPQSISSQSHAKNFN